MRRAAVSIVIGVLLVTGCGRPAPADGTVRPVPDAAPDEQVTLFTEDDVTEDVYRFRITAAFPLPDGTVLLSYDVAAESADDETPTQPRLAVLGAEGVLQPLETAPGARYPHR